MTETLPGLGLTGEWILGEDGWSAAMNAALRALSVLVQTTVLGRVSTLPSPSPGDIYIFTGATVEQNSIAARVGSAWVYFPPFEGWRVYDQGTGNYVVFDGTDWVDDVPPSTFLALSDTPSAYTGQDDKLVAVNGTGTGLVFVDQVEGLPDSSGADEGDVLAISTGVPAWVPPAAGVDAFLDLTDTPSAYTGQGDKLVAVNAGATALVFVDPPPDIPLFGEHVYWRVLWVVGQNATWAGLAELQLNGVTPSGGTASASTFFSGFPASNAFDGNTATYWANAGAPSAGQWLRYQYAAAVEITSVTLQAPAGAAFDHAPLEFTIQYSDDGTTWVEAWSETTTTWAALETRTFNAPPPVFVSSLLDLTDTPSAYTGHEGKRLIVNDAETGTEFAEDADVTTVSASRDLTNDDFKGGQIVLADSGSAIALNIPLGLTRTSPLTIIREGSGAVSITVAGGVAIQSADSLLSLRVQYSGATLIPVGANAYRLVGDLA